MTSHLKDEIAPAALCYYRVSREISLIAPSLGNKDPMQCTLETWILESIQNFDSFLDFLRNIKLGEELSSLTLQWNTYAYTSTLISFRKLYPIFNGFLGNLSTGDVKTS